MYGEVISTEQLTPTMVRVVLGGGTLDEFQMVPATDAYINAQFLPADSTVRIPFGPEDLEAVPADERPKPRRYTVRRWDQDRRELTIDFVAHGSDGYAGPWAQRTEPGDRLQFKGPGGSFRPSAEVDWHLLVGDESALGAIGATLEALPSGGRALVFVVVDGPGHEVDMPTRADAEVVWLHRRDAADPDSQLVDAISGHGFPAGTFDTFVHGEAGEVRAVRKHLVAERGLDPSVASISPYWRRMHTDEAWRQVKRDWMIDQASDIAG